MARTVLLVVSVLTVQMSAITFSQHYVGLGEAADLEQARAAALLNMVQQIQVFVTTSFSAVRQDSAGGFSAAAATSVVARSIVSLAGVSERIERKERGIYRVVKSVSKQSVEEMFARRRMRILDMIRVAESELTEYARGTVNLANVLKNLYWAYLLASIHPDSITFAGHLIPAYASRRVSSLITEIGFRPLKQIDDQPITWSYSVTLDRRPISRLSYEFFDGLGQTLGMVNNGETKMSFFFPGKTLRARDITVAIEHRYMEEMDEILRVADSIAGPGVFPGSLVVTAPGADIQGVAGDQPDVKKNGSIQAVPPALQPLYDAREDVDRTMREINALGKTGRAMIGTSRDFETHEGLYVAVIDAHMGMVALLRFREGILRDVVTQKSVDLRKHEGRRAVWIEVHELHPPTQFR